MASPSGPTNNVFWIISAISWLLLVITEFIAFFYLNNKHLIWTIYRIGVSHHVAETYQGIWPIQMAVPFIYIVFIILFVLTITAFVFYMIKSLSHKDNVIIEGMTGSISRFHFIPIICASVLFIIGESVGNGDHHESMNWWALIFVIIGFASLIFIYMKTNLPCDWLPASIKKGVYSCLLSLEWYYLCYDICNLKINRTGGDAGQLRHALKGYSGFFNVIFGIVGLFMALFFKDLLMAGMYFLIHLGMTVFFFSNSKGGKYNGQFEGVIDIIMIILFLLDAAFIYIKYKKECLN